MRCSAGARWSLFALLLVVRPAGVAAGEPTPQVPSENGFTSVCPPTAENPYAYVIGQGDTLKVLVWKEPELSSEAQVRAADGMITLPLVGEVLAWGRNPEQVRKEVVEKLEKFLEAPDVTVSVSQAQSQRFFVIGQVAKQGEFPLLRRTTVVQALAMAGGFQTFAKKSDIVVVHDRGVDRDIQKVNYKAIEEGDLRNNFSLMAGDTIVVP